MRWVIAFLAGAVFGFIYPKAAPTAKNQVEVNCPAAPECPACPDDPTTMKSLEQHQRLLIKCYEEMSNQRSKLDSCLSDVISGKGETEDWRQKYNSLHCPERDTSW